MCLTDRVWLSKVFGRSWMGSLPLGGNVRVTAIVTIGVVFRHGGTPLAPRTIVSNAFYEWPLALTRDPGVRWVCPLKVALATRTLDIFMSFQLV